MFEKMDNDTNKENQMDAGSKQNESIEKDKAFKEWCGFLTQDILKKIADRYDGKLEFHNSHHTENVVDSASQIGEIMNRHGLMSERDVSLFKLASAFHDSIQGEGSGVNEEKSAKELHIIMDKMEIFNDDDKDKTEEAIMATVAEPAKREDGLSTIVQKNLTRDSSPMALGLALADLGTAGRNSEEFLEEGDKLYEEFQLEGKVPKEGWNKAQTEIATTLKDAFEDKISGLPEGAKKELRELFGSFDESIVKAKERTEKQE